MTTITGTEIRPFRIVSQESKRGHSIEAQGLRKEFPGGVVAVAGIDLDVHEGEIFAFLGPNGAGKTTTVRMLTTLLRPSGGRARVAGFELFTQQHEIRRSIGVALQEAGLDQPRSGYALGRPVYEVWRRQPDGTGRWVIRSESELAPEAEFAIPEEVRT